MKAIIVEGQSDLIVIQTLFPHIARRKIMLRAASSFSNVFAVSKTLKDYGYEVLAVLDTDTNIPGNDNRKVMDRINQTPGLAGRSINIGWMDANLEDVLRKGNVVKVNKKTGGINLRQEVKKNKAALLGLDEFQKIHKYIEG